MKDPIHRGPKPPWVPSDEILPGGFISKWLQRAEWKISEPKNSGLESFKPEQLLERKMKMGVGMGMSEPLMGQFQGSRCFFKRNILNYLILLHSEWEKRKKRPTASLFEATWIYWKWLSGRTKGWGRSLSHTHTPTPPQHTKAQHWFSQMPFFLPQGSKVLPFMLSSCLFLFKIKATTFSKKGKQRKI